MSNRLLKKLGLSDRARAVIFHADDVGFSNASVAAVTELIGFGLLSSASVMMPCPWAKKAVELFKQHPDFCAGIHLTLTCEYEYYNWGGLTRRGNGYGLHNRYGHFHKNNQDILRHNTSADEVSDEINAQIKAALAAGMNPSHIDSHMGTVFIAPYLQNYLALYKKYHLPLLIPRVDNHDLKARGYSTEMQQSIQTGINRLEAEGVPVIDKITGLRISSDSSNRIGQAKEILGSLKKGTITHFICHPAKAGDEMKNITSSWPQRNADFQTFLSAEFKRWIIESGYDIISYRDIQSVI